MIQYPAIIDQFVAQGNTTDRDYLSETWRDFWICLISREASILARKEVLTGKAKFGIVGDGKEVPQVAMARAFQKGDFKAGYYRDQTFMMAIGVCTVEDFFSQLYADQKNDPFSSGRQMNNHFCTPMFDEDDEWIDQTKTYNVSADISCTGGQMARALGHALASSLFKNESTFEAMKKFNNHGKSVTFVSIGDASTSEGAFWETLNAAAVMKVPLATCVYDDGYGISVPTELQTVKGSISKALEGFLLDENGDGIRIYAVNGWDYPGLIEAFDKGISKMRTTHIPALFHIKELTQPQGHSTSGSHERYKNAERLEWEKEFDCIKCMGEWMIESGLASQEDIDTLKKNAKDYVKECRNRAWQNFLGPVQEEKSTLINILLHHQSQNAFAAEKIQELNAMTEPVISELYKVGKQAHLILSHNNINSSQLTAWLRRITENYSDTLDSNLYAENKHSALKVAPVSPVLDSNEKVNGFQILNAYFDQLFASRADVVAFGEDVGYIGDVNQGMAGLQNKYGKNRIFDTGIREWTIIGQAQGLAMRGFRPIAEIQYLDYIYYAFSPLADDLATLRYRTNGQQAAPVIVRTRGHRLEGIWHAGSPIGTLINALRGMYLCVPRNMTQAVGMYNTLLASHDPAVVIECLNGYRLKEEKPKNLDTFKVALGTPEILQKGHQITLVTYGSCVRVAKEALHLCEQMNISVELIDVQTMIPFDIPGIIVESLKKTNRIAFLDEDVPGGATAYMMQQVLEKWEGYKYLDAAPVCITAKEHRTPFGSDGDYFSKPNPEMVAEILVNLANE